MDKRIPVRTCIGCGGSKEKDLLIRIVLLSGQDGSESSELCVDKDCRIKGRGAYICPGRECFDRAVKRKAFARSFRKAFSDEKIEALSEEFLNMIEAGL